MRAADRDAVNIVHELVMRNIDWNAKDDLGRSAIHSAAINGSDRSLAVLLDLPGVDIDLQDVNGNTPIHDAAELSFESSVLKLLLNKGARTDIRNNRGQTPLDRARAKGTRENVLILKEKHADDFGIPKRSMTGMSMEEPTLPQAAAQGDEAAVASILATYADDKSVDIEERDDWLGRTPLQLATDAGHLRIVKRLHQVGANINLQDKYGRTALHIAALQHRMSIARYLLRRGADMTMKDKWGVNVIEAASPSLQILLLEYGIEIEADVDIKHLLFLAAEQGNMKAVQRLIEVGGDVQVKDPNGRSPYERAKQAGKAEVARYLDQIGRFAAESRSHVVTPNTSSDSVNTLRAAAVTGGGIRNNSDRDDHVSGEQRTGDVRDKLEESRSDVGTSSSESNLTKSQTSTQHGSLMTQFRSALTGMRKYIFFFLVALMLGFYLK